MATSGWGGRRGAGVRHQNNFDGADLIRAAPFLHWIGGGGQPGTCPAWAGECEGGGRARVGIGRGAAREPALAQPGIFDVAYRAGGDQDHVDPHILPAARKARREQFGGGGDAAQAGFVDRMVELGGGGARLHLDEGDQPVPAGDEIDFARAGAYPLGQDRPAQPGQVARSDRLAVAAAAFGRLAVRRGGGAGPGGGAAQGFIASARA